MAAIGLEAEKRRPYYYYDNNGRSGWPPRGAGRIERAKTGEERSPKPVQVSAYWCVEREIAESGRTRGNSLERLFQTAIIWTVKLSDGGLLQGQR